MTKKYVWLILFLSLFLLTACNADKTKLKFDETESALNSFFGESGTKTIISEDLEHPKSLEDVMLTWTSNKPEYLTNEGKVNRGEEDQEVESITLSPNLTTIKPSTFTDCTSSYNNRKTCILGLYRFI